MREEQIHKEMNDLYNEVEGLKKVISLMEHVRISDNEIIKLQRKNINHLKMIADDRRVTINQMSEERWAVRKLDEDRYKHEYSHVITDNISKNFTEDRIDDSEVGNITRNFMEDYMNDMDCGDPHWPDGYKCG